MFIYAYDRKQKCIRRGKSVKVINRNNWKFSY